MLIGSDHLEVHCENKCAEQCVYNSTVCVTCIHTHTAKKIGKGRYQNSRHGDLWHREYRILLLSRIVVGIFLFYNDYKILL